jgi:hypothetical protein
MVQSGKFLAQLSPGSQQRRHDLRQIVYALNELADPILKFDGPDNSDLEPKIAQETTNVILNGNRLLLQ